MRNLCKLWQALQKCWKPEILFYYVYPGYRLFKKVSHVIIEWYKNMLMQKFCNFAKMVKLWNFILLSIKKVKKGMKSWKHVDWKNLKIMTSFAKIVETRNLFYYYVSPGYRIFKKGIACLNDLKSWNMLLQNLCKFGQALFKCLPYFFYFFYVFFYCRLSKKRTYVSTKQL